MTVVSVISDPEVSLVVPGVQRPIVSAVQFALEEKGSKKKHSENTTSSMFDFFSISFFLFNF